MVVYIKNVIDFQECARRLSPLFPEHPQAKLANSIERYFWQDQRSEYWVPSCQSALKEIESILVDFIAEETNETQQAAETALQVNCPICPANVTASHPAGAWL